jgi:putative hemolysin
MWFELALILFLIFVNGFFAGAEIAVVTSRRIKVETMANEGSSGAAALLDLKKTPDRFLAAVQVGVTIVGATASAIGGATAVEVVKPFVASLPIPFIEHYAEAVSITSIVVLISYVSLVFGELIPKSIALRDPERFGALVARPVRAFQRISSFAINVLTGTTNLIMKPFGGKAFSERSFVTEEEIKLLVMEGRESGVFDSDEQELIHSVFEFTDTFVKEVMVPIGQAITLDFDTPLDKVLKIIAEEQFSRYPVYGGEMNDIKGVLYAKDVFKFLAQSIGGPASSTPSSSGATTPPSGAATASSSGAATASSGATAASIRKLLRAPFYVPDTMMISSLLRDMQKRRMHMAIAVNEHGLVTGIVTIEDLLEEIVGEIRDEHDTERPVIEIAPGTYIVYASINLRDLKEDYGITIPESPQYDTLGGFVITTLQRIPDGGEIIEMGGAATAAGGATVSGVSTPASGDANHASNAMKLTVLEMVSKRVSKVKIELHEANSSARDRANGAVHNTMDENKT